LSVFFSFFFVKNMGAIESILFPDLVDGEAKSLQSTNSRKQNDIERRRRLAHPESKLMKTYANMAITEVTLGVCHYNYGAYEPVANQIIPENFYSLVQDCVVSCSTSILLFHKDKLLLVERPSYPKNRWWFPIIGLISPGLMPQENCQNLCQEKLGIRVDDLSRYEFVGTYSYLWGVGEDSAKMQSKHEISVVFALHLESNELPKEYLAEAYNDMKWILIEDLSESEHHPALVRALRDYNLVKDLTNLVSNLACEDEIEDSVIGKKFRSWCSNLKVLKLSENMQKRDEDLMKFNDIPKLVVRGAELERRNIDKKKDELEDVQNLDSLEIKQLNVANEEAKNHSSSKAQNQGITNGLEPATNLLVV